ncbi:MAG: phosphate ABC transporter substrate-binding protein [Methanoregulaceae archaeon]
MVQKKRFLILGSLALAGIMVLALLATGCVNSTGTQSTATHTATATATAASTPASASTAVSSAVSSATAAPVQTTAAATATAAPTATKSASTGTKKVTLSGSTTVLPIAQDAADAYMAGNPSYNIQVSGGGSGVGIQAITKKTVDIGMSSRDLTAAELSAQPLTVYKVARDGIAVVVNPKNTIDNLTIQEIQDIYRGQFNNWNQLGGPNLPIVIVGRDSASGTREFFYGSVMQSKAFSSQLIEKNSNGAVAQTVSQTPGAIGYLSIGYMDSSIKAVKLDLRNGTLIAANTDNVKNGSYPLSRYLYFITNGVPSDEAKAFIDYVRGSEGQAIVEKDQYVSL